MAVMPELHPALVLTVAYVAGAVPFSFLAARLVADVDLRDVDTGTVSGTNLYQVAGFGPLAAAGILEVGKGAIGPALSADPTVAAVAAGLAVAGHNWSPFLRGAGGRGISPAMGAFAVVAWPGAVLLIAGVAIGKLADHTGLGSFVAQAALVPLMLWLGWDGAVLAGGLVVAVLWAKRLAGNRPPEGDRLSVFTSRLLFDHDDAFRGPEQA